MSYKLLTGTDLNVSKAALGGALIGTEIPEPESRHLMDCFFECGGNFFDTAAFYANWIPGEKSLSEKVIGRWIKDNKKRNEVVISTKGGHPNFETLNISRLSEKEIMSDIDNSLINLQTDYIDIYFLHRDDKNLPVGEILETLNKIVVSGKARYIGLSNWCHERFQEAIDYCKSHNFAPIAASQIEFGLALPNPGTFDSTTEYMSSSEFEFYKSKDINLISCSAQSGGYFFRVNENGEPIANKKFDNARNREKFFQVMELKKKYNASAAEIIVAALSANPWFNTVPIIGCAREEEVRESMNGTFLTLDTEDVIKLLER